MLKLPKRADAPLHTLRLRFLTPEMCISFKTQSLLKIIIGNDAKILKYELRLHYI